MNKPTAEEQQEKKVAIKIAEKIISIPDNEHLYMSVGAKNAHTLIAPMAYTCCWQGVWSDEMCGSDCCPNDGACEHCQNPIRKGAEGAAVGSSAVGQSGSGCLCVHAECLYHVGWICKHCKVAL